MKQIVRRVGLLVCLAACLLSLAACGKPSDGGKDMTVDVDAREQLQLVVEDYITSFSEQTDEQINMTREQLRVSLEEQAMAPAQIQFTNAMIESLDNWQAMAADSGKLVELDDIESWSFTRGNDGSYVVDAGAKFEKRHVGISVALNERMSTFVTGFQFSPEYTVQENMESAGMNTLMGMGTVFSVLIFISLLIACFLLINRMEARMRAKDAPKPYVAPPAGEAVAAPSPSAGEERLTDDLELVAVITAAIAASENTSSDGLVVRSIRRVSGSRWKRA